MINKYGGDPNIGFDVSLPEAFDSIELLAKPLESGSVKGGIDATTAYRFNLKSLNGESPESALVLPNSYGPLNLYHRAEAAAYSAVILGNMCAARKSVFEDFYLWDIRNALSHDQKQEWAYLNGINLPVDSLEVDDVDNASRERLNVDYLFTYSKGEINGSVRIVSCTSTNIIPISLCRSRREQSNSMPASVEEMITSLIATNLPIFRCFSQHIDKNDPIILDKLIYLYENLNTVVEVTRRFVGRNKEDKLINRAKLFSAIYTYMSALDKSIVLMELGPGEASFFSAIFGEAVTIIGSGSEKLITGGDDQVLLLILDFDKLTGDVFDSFPYIPDEFINSRE